MKRTKYPLALMVEPQTDFSSNPDLGSAAWYEQLSILDQGLKWTRHINFKVLDDVSVFVKGEI